MKVFWKVLKEGRIALTAAIFIEFLAGGILGGQVERLTAIPILLMLIPPLNGFAGGLGTILVARLSTALHLGRMEPKLRGNRGLLEDVAGIVAVGLIISLYLGFIIPPLYGAFGISPPPAPSIVALIIFSALLAALLVVSVGLILSFLSFRRGFDPDNTTIPLVTAVGDVSGVVSLFLVSKLIGLL